MPPTERGWQGTPAERETLDAQDARLELIWTSPSHLYHMAQRHGLAVARTAYDTTQAGQP